MIKKIIRVLLLTRRLLCESNLLVTILTGVTVYCLVSLPTQDGSSVTWTVYDINQTKHAQTLVVPDIISSQRNQFSTVLNDTNEAGRIAPNVSFRDTPDVVVVSKHKSSNINHRIRKPAKGARKETLRTDVFKIIANRMQQEPLLLSDKHEYKSKKRIQMNPKFFKTAHHTRRLDGNKIILHFNKSGPGVPRTENYAELGPESKHLINGHPRKRYPSIIQKHLSRRSYGLSCDDCFVRDFKFTIQATDVCSGPEDNNLPNLDMLVCIFSHPSDYLIRRTLRRLWQKASAANTSPVLRYIFLMGATDNITLQDKVYEEHKLYNDIVQQTFLDTYENLTLKTLAMFDMASAACPNTKYVFKLDQDVSVNVTKVLSVIREESSDKHILGSCMVGAHPSRAIWSKWFIPEDEYPSLEFPPYCQGPHYLVPMRIVHYMPIIARRWRKIRLEDVYVGILMWKTKFGVKHKSAFDLLVPAEDCTIVSNLAAAHGHYKELWENCDLDILVF